MAKILKSISYQSLGRKTEIKSLGLGSTEKLAKKKAIKSDSEIFLKFWEHINHPAITYYQEDDM